MTSRNLDNAKAQKNTAQANLYSVLAGVITLVVIAAILYFVGGWLLKAAYWVITFITYICGAIALLIPVFKKRKSVAEAVAKYPTNRHYIHASYSKKDPSECTDEEKVSIKDELIGNIIAFYVFYGALWFLPLLTGLNPMFQIAPLSYVALPVMALGFLHTMASFVSQLLRLADSKIDQPLDDKWSFGSFIFFKAVISMIVAYFFGIAMIAFGAPLTLILFAIVWGLAFLISIL